MAESLKLSLLQSSGNSNFSLVILLQLACLTYLSGSAWMVQGQLQIWASFTYNIGLFLSASCLSWDLLHHFSTRIFPNNAISELLTGNIVVFLSIEVLATFHNINMRLPLAKTLKNRKSSHFIWVFCKCQHKFLIFANLVSSSSC
jgi:hypothetical protein